jgi:hypothetical protein
VNLDECREGLFSARGSMRGDWPHMHFQLDKRCWPPDVTRGAGALTVCVDVLSARRNTFDGARMSPAPETYREQEEQTYGACLQVHIPGVTGGRPWQIFVVVFAQNPSSDSFVECSLNVPDLLCCTPVLSSHLWPR